jgi:transposase
MSSSPLFLQKYPRRNPIEQLFPKLKILLRKAEARSLDFVVDAIAQILATYAPQECANYIKRLPLPCGRAI